MKKLKGIGVSDGIAIGTAVLKMHQVPEITRRKIHDKQVFEETRRFHDGIQKTVRDIENLIENFSFSQEEKDILEAYKLILTDPEMENEVLEMIGKQLVSVEHAVHRYFLKVINTFEKMEDEYYAQRAVDYRDVLHRLLNFLMGREEEFFMELEKDAVLVMEEVPASLVTKLSDHKIAGIASVKGSRLCHSAIVARSLGIPYVVQLDHLIGSVSNGDAVVLDGHSGDAIINPDEPTLRNYSQLLDEQNRTMDRLKHLVNKPCKTKDGIRVLLRTNIEMPQEVEKVLDLNTDGVGLFRTEFLYIGRDKLPDEDEQTRIYSEIAERLSPLEVIIRTFDIGGDKMPVIGIEKEPNPFLGCRGIRLAFAREQMFRTQIRAILRAAIHGNLKVMFPMISSVEEVRKAKKIIDQCQNELRSENVEHAENLPTGVMIEVPSAALCSDTLARECDFFSIGTNDLIQYTLAVDRNTLTIPEYFNPYNPAVIQLLTLVVQNARKHGINVSVCGEMAADLDFIPFLIGLGITDLSVAPSLHLVVKDILRRINTSSLVELVLDILDQTASTGIHKTINNWRAKHVTSL